MFVPKVPRRFDFCGCPPCPLCFDWVEPDDYIMDGKPVILKSGMDKMVEDILGPGVTPTPEQRVELQKGADAVHIHNINKTKVTPEEAIKDTVAENWVGKEVNSFLERERKKVPAPKPLNTVNIDSIADKAEEKEKEKQPAAEDREKLTYTPPTAESREAQRLKYLAELAAAKEEYLRYSR